MVFESLPFNENVFHFIHNEKNCILQISETIKEISKNHLETSSKKDLILDFLLILKSIDLTTLTGNDTEGSISKLFLRALYPVNQSIIKKLVLENYVSDENNLTVAGFCCYPNYLKFCKNIFIKNEKKDVKLAVVSTGFPSGQLGDINLQCNEIFSAIYCGAQEVDVVINRTLALNGDWEKLYKEICLMRKACKTAKLKVILEVGELICLDTIFKASMVVMYAGADMIKTSTGKAKINATIPYGLVMVRAIRLFYLKTGRMVGLKAAGGIKTGKDALDWITLVRYHLGNEWLNKNYFRIGASSLLKEIEIILFELLFDRKPKKTEINF